MIELVKQHDPELVITDISMPGMTGIAAVAALKRIKKDLRVICLTMHDEQEYAQGAMAAGALGYVLKHEAADDLVDAVNTVLAGKQYLSKSVQIEDTAPNLSPRQLSVLRLLVQGKSAKQVADELFISPRTVEFHKYSIMKLIEAKTTAELIQYAISRGLVQAK